MQAKSSRSAVVPTPLVGVRKSLPKNPDHTVVTTAKTKMLEKEIKAIFSIHWNCGDVNRRRQFIAGCVKMLIYIDLCEHKRPEPREKFTLT